MFVMKFVNAEPDGKLNCMYTRFRNQVLEMENKIDIKTAVRQFKKLILECTVVAKE